MTAILFGSISTLADTSELQRTAFNEAFKQHGLAWQWDRRQYQAMLSASGGVDRIATFADAWGETVDATAVHATKSTLFHQLLAGITPRPGVVDTITQARQSGTKLGFVTTTSPANLAALFDSLDPVVRREDFDVVVTAVDVRAPKPAPDAYHWALRALQESPTHCVAVEDNPGGVEAAVRAGVRCVAFPNSNTAELVFADAERTDVLMFSSLSSTFSV